MIASLISLSASLAANINVNVEEQLAANMSSITYDESPLSNIRMEVYNVGTVPYTARASVEIFKEGRKVFTGWSKKEELHPGDRSPVGIYWYSDSAGKYDAVVELHYANSISEKKIEIENFDRFRGEDAFKIQNLRTYDDKIIFDVASAVDAEDVVIIPDGYPTGWIIEQGEAGEMKRGSQKTVVLGYEPALWYTTQFNLIAASDNGRYATTLTFPLERQSGISGAFNYVADYMKARMAGLEL